MDSKILFVIPARGGSKGIPYKNIKDFCGRPLITYTIDIARKFTSDQHICVSTDDQKIVDVVEDYGLKIPFIRPIELATDTATTNDVLLHAINFYEQQNVFYEKIVLLQPTSPLRAEKHVQEALQLYNHSIDMVVSVCNTNMPSVLCEDNEDGFLELLLNKDGSRRQDVKAMYEYNGAIYVINVSSLKKSSIHKLRRRVKYIMPIENSLDIDTPLDWIIAEAIYKHKY